MSTTNVSVLNDVIETLKDGQAGFRAAAEDVQSPELKELFAKYSLQRSQFAGELQAAARVYGESDPTDSGSAAGALHRGWINLKAALATRDNHAVLAECERGEDIAVSTYKKALESDEITAEVRSTLEAQYAEVKAAHDQVRSLRDSSVNK